MTAIRALLFVSFALNVATLFLPFVDVSMTLKGTDSYNLLRTVVLMWDSGLYVLAVVIVAFSIIFPFVKLAILARLTGRDAPSDTDRRWLARVEALGKWSLIDVFIVCFILALTNDQIFIGATPRPGLYTFLAAIVGSMLAGQWLAHRWGGHGGWGPMRIHPALGGFVLTLATLAFIGVLAIPFLAIEEWILKKTAFTLVTFLRALLAQGAPIVAVVLTLGLVVVPTIQILGAWGRLIAEQRGRLPAGMSAAFPQVRNWSLLDVFFVSLLVFLVEADSLMTVGARQGLFLLSFLIVIQFVFGSLRRAGPRASAASPSSG